MPRRSRQRRVVYVTGSRAEFGLMRRALGAIATHPKLSLSLLVTGMHLDRSRGHTIDDVRASGLPVAASFGWEDAPRDASDLARRTGEMTAWCAAEFARLGAEVVLVTGDRVEAFAAAGAAQVAGRVLAHVHGGDRAQGQADDSLRHAITKLAHVHFVATRGAADRVYALGEERWRIRRVGAPGLDGIRGDAAPRDAIKALAGDDDFALLVLHPESANNFDEKRKAKLLLEATLASVRRAVIVDPNSDPGAAGIVAAWDGARTTRLTRLTHADRATFLGLLRDCRLLLGNSSSGIIEAASFGTRVLDVGDRQCGREHGPNVRHAPFDAERLRSAIARIVREGPRRSRRSTYNVWGDGRSGSRIAAHLAALDLSPRLAQKLIRY